MKTIRDKMSAIAREEDRKIPLRTTKPELTPAQKTNLIEEEEEVSEDFQGIDDLFD